MNKIENPRRLTRDGKRIHIIHDRSDCVSYGYVVDPDETGRNLHVRVARAICSNQDNFNKKVANSILRTRLNTGIKGSNEHRMFEATIAMPQPSDSREWRELDQTVVNLADLRLTAPDEIRWAHEA